MTNYDYIAEWYDQSVRAGTLLHDIVEPILFDLVGDVRGLRICDLACGQGTTARKLAQRGANVVGVDVSAKLLAIAQREEQHEPRGITYIHDDAQTLTTLNDATFDGVLCNMALMDIPDMDAVFQQVCRILYPSGLFVCSITHPCFQTPKSQWITTEQGSVSRAVQDYFEEGFWRSDNVNGVRGQVGAYHRTLSTYINSLANARFMIERIVEPQVTGQLVERVPGYKEVPVAMMFACRNTVGV